jgi:hypothetical protein
MALAVYMFLAWSACHVLVPLASHSRSRRRRRSSTAATVEWSPQLIALWGSAQCC